MKYKLIPLLLTLSVALCLSLSLAACDETPAEEKGADGHTHIAETFNVNEEQHWKTCTVCGEKFSAENHSYLADNACETCGYSSVYTKGLTYLLDKVTGTYTVQSIGDARDVSELIIPAYYEGKAVASIGSEGFDGRTSLESVVIPAGVTSIGSRAFYGCANLSSVKGASKLASIGNYAFSHCGSLRKISLPAGVTSIGENAFEYTSLTEIGFGGTVAKWQALQKGDGWDNETGNYTVTCSDGKVAKDGTVTMN